MSEKVKTVEFGAPDRVGAYVFRVDIPEARGAAVVIVEHYGYEGGERGIPLEEERVRLARATWSGIADAARQDFNERLKARKLATSRWKTGANRLDRLLGKELCVLAWAAEIARPEERWWLFAMTVAEAGLPEDRERGWRRALYAALADGNLDAPVRRRPRPVDERDLGALPLFRLES